MHIIKRHHSPRGLPLACHQPAKNRSILTVELSKSPGDLYLIHPSGNVSRVRERQLDAYAEFAQINTEELWADTAFNARHFNSLARFLGVIPCEIARQIVMGRWVLAGNTLRSVRLDAPPDPKWAPDPPSLEHAI